MAARGSRRPIRRGARITGVQSASTRTDSKWTLGTPLAAAAAALVTDTGGILSRAVIVARGYGLPAVVGCDIATSAIREGARVEVDGDGGRVRVALRRVPAPDSA